ncbi:MAG: sulfite exporter TauE/SafE family protein [Bacteroidota bacterium]
MFLLRFSVYLLGIIYKAIKKGNHNMGNIIAYLLLGLAAGILSGLVGIGGGILIVPALVFLFGFSQQQAQGTTLALLVPPIGILAAWTYYQHGFVNLQAALFIATGFIAGSFYGARFVTGIPNSTLEKIFGAFLVLIGLKMIFGK